MTLYQTFALQIGQRVAGSHEAYAMDLRQLAFGINHFARLQLSLLNPSPDCFLNTPVRRQAIPIGLCSSHFLLEVPRSSTFDASASKAVTKTF